MWGLGNVNTASFEPKIKDNFNLSLQAIIILMLINWIKTDSIFYIGKFNLFLFVNSCITYINQKNSTKGKY